MMRKELLPTINNFGTLSKFLKVSLEEEMLQENIFLGINVFLGMIVFYADSMLLSCKAMLCLPKHLYFIIQS